MINNIPFVSVCVQTYQHKNFIKQCLDGILMQQTTFPFEVILGEDESNDGTREICKEYAEKHPEKIRLFLRSRKDVIYINGKPSGRFNFIENLKACKGKYIALCEGDDYWTDPLKLQKQVDFLEENPEYGICFHKVKILTIKDEIVDDFITEERYDRIKDFPITNSALLKHSNFIHTPSVIFKNIIDKFPIEFYFSPVGDYLLYFILSKNGYIHRINESMAIYRYGQGIYSRLSKKEKSIIGKQFQISLLSYTESDGIKESILKGLFKNVKRLENNNIENFTVIDLFKIIIKRIKYKIKR